VKVKKTICSEGYEFVELIADGSQGRPVSNVTRIIKQFVNNGNRQFVGMNHYPQVMQDTGQVFHPAEITGPAR
jgi:hypothetical protein